MRWSGHGVSSIELGMCSGTISVARANADVVVQTVQ